MSGLSWTRGRLFWTGCVALLLIAGAGCTRGAAAPERPAHRLLVVGWDGASFRWLDPLLESGRLPNLARLAERGTTAQLESTRIPISSAAWTAAVTGVGPGENGVYDFFEPVPGSYDVRLISSRSNRAPPLWRILTARGLRTVVFGVPVTFPPEPVFGTMVAGMLSPHRADFAWPDDLSFDLRARGFVPDVGIWRQAHVMAWEDLWHQLDLKEEILLELLEQDDWDFAMVVFKSLDVVSHFAYQTDFAQQIEPLLERLDAILGTLLEAVGEETNVLLVSDHGFRVYERGFNLFAWLEDERFAARDARAKRIAIRGDEPLDRRTQKEIHGLRAVLDWSATRAFPTTCEGNFGGLRLNVRGREPAGIVPPEELEAECERIAARLRALEHDGVPLVHAVLRGEELYPGPYRDVVPDLIFEVAPDCQVFTDIDEARILGAYDVGIPDHDLQGVLVAAGPSIAQRAERGQADILDLAPSALHLLGLPVLAEMQGRALTELWPALPEPRAIPRAELRTLAAAPDAGGSPFSAAELEELTERLGALGYTE